MHADQGGEEGGLPRAVAAHQGDGLAAPHGEVHAAQRLGPPAADTERPDTARPARPGACGSQAADAGAGRPRRPPRRASAGRRRAVTPGQRARAASRRRPPCAGRRAPTAAAGTSPRGGPGPPPAGTRGRRPSSRPGSPSTGAAPGAGSRTTWSAYWTTRSRRCSAIRTVVPRSWTRRWRTARTSSAAAGSSAEVGSSRTRTLGCGVRTEPIATRCCWPPERVAMGAVAQIGQAQQVQGLLDAAAHHVGGQAQRLHAVGELVLDGVRDEVGERVLAHRADHVGEFARLVGAGVAAGDGHPAAQGAAGEVRDQAADRAEERGLADPGGADQQAPARPRGRSGRRPGRRARRHRRT